MEFKVKKPRKKHTRKPKLEVLSAKSSESSVQDYIVENKNLKKLLKKIIMEESSPEEEVVFTPKKVQKKKKNSITRTTKTF